MELNRVLLNENLPSIDEALSSKDRIKVLLVLARAGGLNISEITKCANLSQALFSGHCKKNNNINNKIFSYLIINKKSEINRLLC